ncbi:MAG: response regulator [Candidatus Binatia bacterium]
MTACSRVLLIEDDASQREPLTLLFELKGYDIAAAASVPEAWEMLNAGLQPRVIILDLMMPGMDGIAFRRAQMLDPVVASIPVILYSGGADLDRIARNLDVVGHVAKPGNFDRLFGLVGAHCRA